MRVYFEDTDSGGVVYYANYLKFMERARTEWLRAQGLEQDQLRRQWGILFMVRSASLDYRRPARFNDLLNVDCQIGRRQRASITFVQRVTLAATPQRILCDGSVRVACVDADSGKPLPLPESVAQALSAEAGSRGER